MTKDDCIYPDCQIKTEFGYHCEHSCPYESQAKALALTMENCALREALDDIAIGVHGLGVLSKDNMRRRALEALKGTVTALREALDDIVIGVHDLGR